MTRTPHPSGFASRSQRLLCLRSPIAQSVLRLISVAWILITQSIAKADDHWSDDPVDMTSGQPADFFQAYDQAVAVYNAIRTKPESAVANQIELGNLLSRLPALAHSRLGFTTSTIEARCANAVLFITWNSIALPRSDNEVLPRILRRWFAYYDALLKERVHLGEGPPTEWMPDDLKGVTPSQVIGSYSDEPGIDRPGLHPTFWRVANLWLADLPDNIAAQGPVAMEQVSSRIEELRRRGEAVRLFATTPEDEQRLDRLAHYLRFRAAFAATDINEAVVERLGNWAIGVEPPPSAGAESAILDLRAALAPIKTPHGQETLGVAVAWKDILVLVSKSPCLSHAGIPDKNWTIEHRSAIAGHIAGDVLMEDGCLRDAPQQTGSLSWSTALPRLSFEGALWHAAKAGQAVIESRQTVKGDERRRLLQEAAAHLVDASTANGRTSWVCTSEELARALADIALLCNTVAQSQEWNDVSRRLDELRSEPLRTPASPNSEAESIRLMSWYLAKTNDGKASSLSGVRRSIENLDDCPGISQAAALKELREACDDLKWLATQQTKTDRLQRDAARAQASLELAALLRQSASFGETVAKQGLLIATYQQRIAQSERRVLDLQVKIAALERDTASDSVELSNRRVQLREDALEEAAALVAMQESAVEQSLAMSKLYEEHISNLQTRVLDNISAIEEESKRKSVFAFFKALAKVVAVVAAPFTGGASLSAIGPIESAIGVVEQASALNWRDPAAILKLATDAAGSAQGLGINVGAAIPASVKAWFDDAKAMTPAWLLSLPTDAQAVHLALKQAGVSMRFTNGQLEASLNTRTTLSFVDAQFQSGLADWAGSGVNWCVGPQFDVGWRAAVDELQRTPAAVHTATELFNRVMVGVGADAKGQLEAAKSHFAAALDGHGESAFTDLKAFAAAMSLRAVPVKAEGRWTLAVPEPPSAQAVRRLKNSAARLEVLKGRLDAQQESLVNALNSALNKMQQQADVALSEAQAEHWQIARQQVAAAAQTAKLDVGSAVQGIRRALEESKVAREHAQDELEISQVEQRISVRKKEIAELCMQLASDNLAIGDLRVETANEARKLAEMHVGLARSQTLAADERVRRAQEEYFNASTIAGSRPQRMASIAAAVNDGCPDGKGDSLARGIRAIRELSAWKRLMGVSNRAEQLDTLESALKPLLSRQTASEIATEWRKIEEKMAIHRLEDGLTKLNQAGVVRMQTLTRPEEAYFTQATKGSGIPNRSEAVGVVRFIGTDCPLGDVGETVRFNNAPGCDLGVVMSGVRAAIQPDAGSISNLQLSFVVLPPLPWEWNDQSDEQLQRPAKLFWYRGSLDLEWNTVSSSIPAVLPGELEPSTVLRRRGVWRLVFFHRRELEGDNEWAAFKQRVRTEVPVWIGIPVLPK